MYSKKTRNTIPKSYQQLKKKTIPSKTKINSKQHKPDSRSLQIKDTR